MFQKTETINTTLVPPDPFPFNISTDYYQRATEGARAWKLRPHKISASARRNIRTACLLCGIALSTFCAMQAASTLKMIAWVAWLLLPLLGEGVMGLVEYRHDVHLKETVFDPRYNPNPRGYRKYARDYAKYESEVRKVYLSPQGIYHSNRSCGNEQLSDAQRAPRWKAIYKNIKPCPRCGHVTIKPRKLPPPFGKGRPPQN